MARPIAWKDVGFKGGGAANMAVAQRGFSNLSAAAKNINDRFRQEDRDMKADEQRALTNALAERTATRADATADRQQQEFDWKKGDRAAEQEYMKVLGQGPQTRAVFTDSEDFVKQAEESAYTDKELGILKSGKSTPAIEAKTKAQTLLSDIANKYGEGDMIKETRGELSGRAISDLLAGGQNVSADVYGKHEGILAADVAARDAKRKASTTSIAATGKQLDSLRKELAKSYNVTASKGSKSGGSSGSKYLKKGTTYNKWIDELKDKISVGFGAGSAAAFVGLGDKADANNIDAKMNDFGYSDDKKAYVLDNLVNYGIDNNLDSAEDVDALVLKYSKAYDGSYDKYSGGTKADKSVYQAELKSQISGLEKQLGRDSQSLKTSSLSAEEGRDAYVKSLLGSKPAGVVTPKSGPKSKPNKEIVLGGDKKKAKVDEKVTQESLFGDLPRSEITEPSVLALDAPAAPTELLSTKTADDKRRSNAPIPKFLESVSAGDPALNRAGADIGNRLLQTATAGAGGVYRAGEFFTDPFLKGYNYLTGNEFDNPLTGLAEASERASKAALAKQGITGEAADRTIAIQELLTPLAGGVKRASSIPKSIDKLLDATGKLNAAKAAEAVKNVKNVDEAKAVAKMIEEAAATTKNTAEIARLKEAHRLLLNKMGKHITR